MEKRLLLAVVVSFVLLWIYQTLFFPAPPKKQTESPSAAAVSPTEKKVEPEEPPEPVTPSLPALPDQDIAGQIDRYSAEKEVAVNVTTNKYDIAMSNRGAGFTSIKLKEYTQLTDSHLFDLLEQNKINNTVANAMTIQLGNSGELTGAVYKVTQDAPREKEFVYITQGGYLSSDGRTIKSQVPAGLKVTKKFTFFSDSYIVRVALTIEDLKQRNTSLQSIRWQHEDKEYIGGLAVNWLTGTAFEQKENVVSYYADNKLYSEKANDKKPVQIVEKKPNLSWVAVGSHYFLSLLDIRNIETNRMKLVSKKKNMGYSLLLPPLSFTDHRIEKEFLLYIGPKKYDLLKDTIPVLKAEKVIDYSIFWSDTLAALPLLLLNILKFFYGLVQNYGVAIILLTILLSIIMYPLRYKSMKSMQEMQKLQPEIQKLKEKYGKDKQKLNEETMRMYKEHGVNPMGGCLPIFIQLPVFIGLFRMLQNAIELRGATFLYLKDLSAADTLFTNLMNLPFTLGPLPLIMGATMFLQQKLTPVTNPEQAKTMMFLPLIFTVMFISMPSGLILYWTTFNIISVGQQLLQNRSMK